MLVTAFLCRNEATKDLRRVLTDARRYSDSILVLDDGSTDDSMAVATACGAEVRQRGGSGMWGNESTARQELWNWGAEVCGDGWLLICDCDQVLLGDPRPYTASWDCNAWSFVLYDLWDSEQTYRTDGYWKAHTVPRPWLFRPSAVPDDWVPEWSPRGIHTGHCPSNFPLLSGWASDLAFQHHAYLTPERRKHKYEAYAAKVDQLTPVERAHAASIMD